MAKSSKAVVKKRVADIAKMITAGGQLADIDRYARQQGWNVSPRQLRRYCRDAYKIFADQRKLEASHALGKVLAQANLIMARALKNNDDKLALKAIDMVAKLQGLFPGKGSARQIAGWAVPTTNPIPRIERVQRLLQARLQGDEKGIAIIEQGATQVCFLAPDTLMMSLFLEVLALAHSREQNSRVCKFLFAKYQIETSGDPDGHWDLVASVNAYLYCTAAAAWMAFVVSLKLSDELLLDDDQSDYLIEIGMDGICGHTPTPEEIAEKCRAMNQPLQRLPTVEEFLQGFKEQFGRIDCG